MTAPQVSLSLLQQLSNGAPIILLVVASILFKDLVLGLLILQQLLQEIFSNLLQ